MWVSWLKPLIQHTCTKYPLLPQAGHSEGPAWPHGGWGQWENPAELWGLGEAPAASSKLEWVPWLGLLRGR